MSEQHTNVTPAGYEVTRDGRVFSTKNWRGADDEDVCIEVRQARAAIAKATGEQP